MLRRTTITLAFAISLIVSSSSALVAAHVVTCAAFTAPHTYGSGGTVGTSSSMTGRNGAGVVTVSDNNVGDCDGDGVPGDFDGDYESGVGGGFFGAGFWANEATCQYGLKTHGTSVTVTDALSANIAFVTGADDMQGPIVVPDPVNGGNICETDGSITPGDPATEPTADADDCASDVFINTGSACGTGGDGGYWVFIDPECEWEILPPGAECSGTATVGFITA